MEDCQRHEAVCVIEYNQHGIGVYMGARVYLHSAAVHYLH